MQTNSEHSSKCTKFSVSKCQNLLPHHQKQILLEQKDFYRSQILNLMSNFVEEFSLDLKMLQSFLQYTLYFNKMVSERLREDIIFLSFQVWGNFVRRLSSLHLNWISYSHQLATSSWTKKIFFVLGNLTITVLQTEIMFCY